MARSGNIMLCKNIELDRDYKNILNYTEEQMVSLCSSSDHIVANSSSYSFIGAYGERRIKTNFTYHQCLQSNYIAFQNTYYDNKWFFAFIDDIKYLSDGATEITYTVDECSTWFDDWTPKRCFVIREHTNDDTVGANTVREPIDTGDYICMNSVDAGSSLAPSYIVLGVSDVTSAHTYLDGTVYSGTYSGLLYYAYPYSVAGIKDLNDKIYSYDQAGKGDAVVSLFYAPHFLLDGLIADDNTIDPSFDAKSLTNQLTYNFSQSDLESWSKTCDGYTPKNKKLLTYPYRYITMDNNCGSSVIYQYELFTNNKPAFRIDGALSVGCSIKLTPLNYCGVTTNYLHSMMLGKYNTCSWNSDVYTNWLTQSAVNNGVTTAKNAFGVVASTAEIFTGDAVEGTFGLISSSGALLSQFGDIYEHDMIPGQVKGNTNGGDIAQALQKNTFTYYDMSIKKEQARIIDDYFTRFGYKVNRLKVPNQTGRRYWNYVEIGANEDIGFGSVPTKSMEIINKAYRRGVTVWHNHANIGNYSLDNAII